MKGVKLLTLPVNATVPHMWAKRFLEASPPSPTRSHHFGVGCLREGCAVASLSLSRDQANRDLHGVALACWGRKRQTSQEPLLLPVPPGAPDGPDPSRCPPSPAGTRSCPPCPGVQRSTGSSQVWGSQGTDAGRLAAACVGCVRNRERLTAGFPGWQQKSPGSEA